MSKVTSNYTIDEKEYTLTELTHGDWVSLQKYIQYRKYTLLKKDVEQLPDVEALLPDVLKECANNPVSMVSIENHLSDADTITEVVYLSLRHYHQGITHDEVEGILTFSNMQEILPLIFGLSGIVDDDNQDDGKKKVANA